MRSVRSCASPRNLKPSGTSTAKRQTAFGVQFLERAHQPLDDRLDLGHDADGPRPRGRARAVEIEGHLPAHDFGLLAHLVRQARSSRIGLVDEHAERRLQRVSEIADLGARALDNLAIGVEQLVHFGRERGDILREIRRRCVRPRPGGSPRRPRAAREAGAVRSGPRARSSRSAPAPASERSRQAPIRSYAPAPRSRRRWRRPGRDSGLRRRRRSRVRSSCSSCPPGPIDVAAEDLRHDPSPTATRWGS